MTAASSPQAPPWPRPPTWDGVRGGPGEARPRCPPAHARSGVRLRGEGGEGQRGRRGPHRVPRGVAEGPPGPPHRLRRGPEAAQRGAREVPDKKGFACHAGLRGARCSPRSA